MDKKEKTRITREKIIRCALVEFGSKSYDVASLNVICSENQISKGLIYHNFKNKDELYLVCVKRCYEAMIEYLKDTSYDDALSIHERLKQALQARQRFFTQYPDYQNIFFHSLLLPPQHLLKELQKLRLEYDEYMRERYLHLLNKVELRENVSLEKAVDYFMTFQEMYNGYFKSMSYPDMSFEKLITIHESKLSELLDIMLYGIAKQ